MIGFGILVGIIFPPFARIMLNSEEALSIKFLLLCIFAGIIVGVCNYSIFSIVISKQLKKIVEGMEEIIKRTADTSINISKCDTYQIIIDSNDHIGKLTKYFNDMSISVCYRIREESFLKNLSSRLSHSTELNDIANILLENILQLSNSTIGILYGYRDDSLIKLSVIGIDTTDKVPITLDKSYGIISYTIEKNELVNISFDDAGLKWIESSSPLGSIIPKNLIIIPFSIESRIVAIAIVAGSGTTIPEFNMKLINSIRKGMAAYLSNAILHERIKMLSDIDDLTQLLNRRFGLKRLNEEFSRSLRHGIPLSLIMIDIDHFKNINDTYGHDAGDEILKFVSRQLEKGLRASDVVCRYGGEEFVIIAAGAGMIDAGKIADRIRKQIEKSVIKFGDKEININISAGISTWPVCKTSTGAELVSFADRALYYAKEHGRNQIVIFDGTNFNKYTG